MIIPEKAPHVQPVARTTSPKPPRHLSRSSRALWRRLVADYALERESHMLEILRLGCEALDRAADARDAVARHGAVYLDRFGAPRPRPEVAIERDARLAALRAFRELMLDDADEARPPRIGSGALR